MMSATIRAMRARSPSVSLGEIVPLMRSSAAPSSGLVSMASMASGASSSSASPYRVRASLSRRCRVEAGADRTRPTMKSAARVGSAPTAR